jgi:lipoate-protein ligase B
MADELCAVHRLGLIPYERAWRLQERLALEIARGARPPTLLLLEHPHTFTFGSRGQPDHLLWDEDECRRRGVQVHRVDRGGDVTYHGPGQLVGYPLLPLGEGGLLQDPVSGRQRLPRADYVGYLRSLERVLIASLDRLGVTAVQIEGLTGVWVPRLPAGGSRPRGGASQAKIAALGVKVDARGISRHGFALNVDPDMTYWEGIIGCGLENLPVTSLARLLEPIPTMAAVSAAVETAFSTHFGYKLMPAETALV